MKKENKKEVNEQEQYPELKKFLDNVKENLNKIENQYNIRRINNRFTTTYIFKSKNIRVVVERHKELIPNKDNKIEEKKDFLSKIKEFFEYNKYHFDDKPEGIKIERFTLCIETDFIDDSIEGNQAEIIYNLIKRLYLKTRGIEISKIKNKIKDLYI